MPQRSFDIETFTRWILRHRRLVAIGWIALTIVGMGLAGPASDAMDQQFTVPGREGFETNQTIEQTYGGTGGNQTPLLPIVTLPEGKTVDDPEVARELAGLERTVREGLEGSRVAGYASTGDDAFVSEDRRTTFVLAYPTPDPESQFGENIKAAEDAAAALSQLTIAGEPVYVTGYDALVNEVSGDQAGESGVLIEALIGGLGALVILAFVFGSFLALAPLMMAVPAILTSFSAAYLLTFVTDISPIVQFLIALIGLGVSIDYSLLLVVRWREELSNGASREEAVINAMKTSGRAVIFSGTTVAISLLALIFLPLPFLRSVGYGGMLIPLMSVAVALTLLPVILYSIGQKLDWPHRRTDHDASRAWTRWGEAVVRRRVVAASVGAAMLGALVIAATMINFGVSDLETVSKEGPAESGLTAFQDSGIGSGAVLPDEILVTGSTDPATVADELDGVEGVHGAVSPSSSPGNDDWTTGDSSVVVNFTQADPSTQESRDTLDRIQGVSDDFGSDVAVGGFSSQNQDFIDAVYGNFPLMIGLIAFITFILLARAFRSILLPIKAVILNVISVAAAWGVMVLVWQEGFGSELIWDIPATGSITSWLPLMVFAFLFGLSMDYEVFILSRMREEYDRTGSTDIAVVRGIARTGRLVTSAALILFFAFVSLASGPETEIKVFATGLAAGILIDATIVRGLLVPAVVSLFGRWNWVLPEGPAKLLRVEPSNPPPEPARS